MRFCVFVLFRIFGSTGRAEPFTFVAIFILAMLWNTQDLTMCDTLPVRLRQHRYALAPTVEAPPFELTAGALPKTTAAAQRENNSRNERQRDPN